MSGDLLPCVEVEPRAPARAAVIWLHGLGADGHDFEPIVPALGLPGDLAVRFVFPHAPKRAVTINMGLIMPAWYDIRGFGPGAERDEAGMRASAERVRALVARENGRGVPSSRLVLAGFSQGGALALHVGLRLEEAIAGIVALSCHLGEDTALERDASAAGRRLPIFQAHGRDDPLIPLAHGEEARDRLIRLGCEVEWRSYPVAHEVDPDEIREIGAFIARRLAPPRTG